jgi:hypothetical protein
MAGVSRKWACFTDTLLCFTVRVVRQLFAAFFLASSVATKFSQNPAKITPALALGDMSILADHLTRPHLGDESMEENADEVSLRLFA